MTLLLHCLHQPVSSPSPEVGGLLRRMRNMADMGSDPLSFFSRVQAESGEVAWFPFGHNRGLLLGRPEHAQSVLVDNQDAFYKIKYLRVFFRPVLGNGLLTSEDDLHRRQRRLIAPTFSPARVTGYAVDMVEYAEGWVQRWSDGQVIDLGREMMALTLCIVGKVLFDADLRNQTDTVGQALTDVMELVDRRASSLLPLPQSWPTPSNRRFNNALARLDAIIYQMIAERRAAPGSRPDVLSILLAAQDEDGSGMTDQQVRDEALTMLLAGHETTANALTWTWYLLCRYPEVYDRMCAELDTTLQGRAPTFQDLPRLPYTLQVFKEAMRLYPPAWVIGRTSRRAVDVCGLAVPADTEVILCIFLMHRRSATWPDPERFDPNRFRPETEAQLPRFAYMPFGGGARVCYRKPLRHDRGPPHPGQHGPSPAPGTCGRWAYPDAGHDHPAAGRPPQRPGSISIVDVMSKAVRFCSGLKALRSVRSSTSTTFRWGVTGIVTLAYKPSYRGGVGPGGTQRQTAEQDSPRQSLHDARAQHSPPHARFQGPYLGYPNLVVMFISDYGAEPTRDSLDAMPGPVLVEFGTEWCGFCQAIQPDLQRLMASYPNLRHVKVEDGRGRLLGRSFGVKLWPTLVFMRDGQVLGQVSRPSVGDIESGLQRLG